MVLSEAVWGEQAIGVRRLHSLISGLPPTSALARELYPDTVGADWGVTEELLATALELIDLGNRQFLMANSKSGTSAPKPIRITRPWESSTKRSATLSEIGELMGGKAPIVASEEGSP